MKKIIWPVVFVLLFVTGCSQKQKNFLPEAKNDKTYTNVGITSSANYTIDVPSGYIYEKDYDNGILEESWEHPETDDVQICVTTYENSDEITARGKFLEENNDYVFEDLLGYSLCGTEPDGDTLWFNTHVSGRNVYIVSWEYPAKAEEELKKELSDIAQSFKDRR